MMGVTLSDKSLSQVVEAARRSSGATRIIFVDAEGRQETTLAELISRAERVASGLRRLGLEPRDQVAVQMSNRPEAVVLQYAALMLDLVLVPIVPVFGHREVSQILADAGPKALVTQARWRKFDYLANLRELPADIRPPLVVAADGAPGGTTPWENLEAAEPIGAWADAPEDSVCLVIYTSGSTGVPKGVQHTRAGILGEALDLDYRPQRSDRDLYLQASGAGHIGGYMYPMRAALYGMRCVVMDGWDAPLACRLIDTYKITSMVATPFHVVSMLESVAEGGTAAGADLSSVRLLMIGGSPVRPELVIDAQKAGMTAVRAYGMSEHPTVAIGDPDDPLDIRAHREGRVTPNNRVRLVDDAGRPVPPGSPGEIQTRGPERFIGYTNVPLEETFTPDGWFPTGDIGVLDEEGYLTVVDRKKNIIIRGGENLSATEIENVVSRHPAVAEVAVIGVPDPRYGERACAFVVLREGHTLDLEELGRHFAACGVARQKVPERLEFVSSLPRSGTGKIRKHELARLLSRA